MGMVKKRLTTPGLEELLLSKVKSFQISGFFVSNRVSWLKRSRSGKEDYNRYS